MQTDVQRIATKSTDSFVRESRICCTHIYDSFIIQSTHTHTIYIRIRIRNEIEWRERRHKIYRSVVRGCACLVCFMYVLVILHTLKHYFKAGKNWWLSLFTLAFSSTLPHYVPLYKLYVSRWPGHTNVTTYAYAHIIYHFTYKSYVNFPSSGISEPREREREKNWTHTRKSFECPAKKSNTHAPLFYCYISPYLNWSGYVFYALSYVFISLFTINRMCFTWFPSKYRVCV